MDNLIRFSFIVSTIFQSIFGISLLWGRSYCPTTLMIYTIYGVAFLPITLVPYWIWKNRLLPTVLIVLMYLVTTIALFTFSIYMKLMNAFCSDDLIYMAFLQGLTIPGIISLTIETFTETFHAHHASDVRITFF